MATRLGAPGIYTLLRNESATGEYQEVQGGTYMVEAEGTAGGATLTLQFLGADGATARDVTALTVGTPATIDVGDGTQMRVAVAGGSPSGLYAVMRAI